MPTWHNIVIALAVLMLAGTANADDQPGWMTKPPKDDTYLYYIGRAANEPDEATAFRDGTNDAIAQAIRENFGMSAQVGTESYEDTNKSMVTTRFNELSQRAHLERFEQQDFYRELTDDNHVNLWILYRYSKTAMLMERKRLAQQKDDEDRVEFSIVGPSAATTNGVVEVITKPAGATVYIDHESFGRTPLRLIGQIAPGEHLLRLDLPNFESVEQQVIVPTGKTVRVSKNLARATGRLTINTTPPNATVNIAGRIYSTPTEAITLVAGEKNELVITHPDAERYSQTIEVGATENRTLEVRLPLRPAHISINTTPTSATFRIGDKTYTTPAHNIPIQAGSYHVTLSHPGMIDETCDFTIRGGQSLVIPSIAFSPISKTQSYFPNRTSTSIPWAVLFPEVGFSENSRVASDNSIFAQWNYERNFDSGRGFRIGFDAAKTMVRQKDENRTIYGVIAAVPLQVSATGTAGIDYNGALGLHCKKLDWSRTTIDPIVHLQKNNTSAGIELSHRLNLGWHGSDSCGETDPPPFPTTSHVYFGLIARVGLLQSFGQERALGYFGQIGMDLTIK